MSTPGIEDVKAVDVIGTLWTDKDGNTYHSARINVTFVDSLGTVRNTILTTEYDYGYGNQYEYSAFDKLAEYGIVPLKDTKGMTVPWRYYEDRGINYTRRDIRVPARKDMI